MQSSGASLRPLREEAFYESLSELSTRDVRADLLRLSVNEPTHVRSKPALLAISGEPIFHRDDSYSFPNRRDGLIGIERAVPYVAVIRSTDQASAD